MIMSPVAGLELGIGVGEYGADNAALGLDAWPAKERIDRLEEQLAMLDRLLRGERLDHAGRFYRAKGAQHASPIHRPRPPLVVAAQAPRGLQLVAGIADGWSTLGGQPRPADPVSLTAAIARTREQVRLLEQYCRELGRDMKTLRRSVLAFRTEVDPLSSLDAFDEFVEGHSAVGIQGFVFYWPPIGNLRRQEPLSAAQRSTLERIAAHRSPSADLCRASSSRTALVSHPCHGYVAVGRTHVR